MRDDRKGCGEVKGFLRGPGRRSEPEVQKTHLYCDIAPQSTILA